MFMLIIWSNSGQPYTYGPFDTRGEAKAFALDHDGYRWHIAQHCHLPRVRQVVAWINGDSGPNDDA